MNKRDSIIYIFLLFICCLSCNKGLKIEKEVRTLQSCPINLPLDSLEYISNGYTILNSNDHLKFIVYSDTTACSSCEIKQMYKWDGFIKEVKAFNKNIEIYFIFSPQRKNIDIFYFLMTTNPPASPIFVDTTNIFLRSNLHIPKNPALHTFLLDEKNNVILVGNPLKNKHIEEMFWRIVKEKSGNPKDAVEQ